jgi:uncharacterized protein YcnI
MSSSESIRTKAHSVLRRTLPVIGACIAVILSVPVIALAHAVVYPRASTTGAYERYVLRVPNEKTSPTTRVEIRFPGDVRVTSFEDVPGWQLEVLTDSAKRIIGAVWTGTLAPQRFVEFPFMGANPKSDGRLVWPAYQTYADGERVEWTGDEGSKRPASVTTIANAATNQSRGLLWVPWVALLVALLSLGLVMRKAANPVTSR